MFFLAIFFTIYIIAVLFAISEFLSQPLLIIHFFIFHKKITTWLTGNVLVHQ